MKCSCISYYGFLFWWHCASAWTFVVVCYILLANYIPVATNSVVNCQLRPKNKFLCRSCRTINIFVKYFFPNWNVRSHWPMGPKLAPLADGTLCVCTLDNFGFWGSELKTFPKQLIHLPLCPAMLVLFHFELWLHMWCIFLLERLHWWQ